MTMSFKHLVAVEKWTLGLAALATAVSLFLLPRRFGFGVTVGAGLMALNAWVLRRLGARILGGFKRPGLAILLFNVKMAVLMLLVALILRYLPLHPVGFLLGISIFPLAIVAVAVRHAWSRAELPDEAPHG